MDLILQIIATALSLAHVTLNAFRKRVCWLFNITALCLWVWLYARLHLPIILGLMVVYVALSIFGWIQWGRKSRQLRVSKEWMDGFVHDVFVFDPSEEYTMYSFLRDKLNEIVEVEE